MTSKRKTILSSLILLVLVLSLSLSFIYVVTELHHECDGEDCQICANLEVCSNVLKSTLYAGAIAVTAFSIRKCMTRNTAIKDIFLMLETPITLKVKLTD